MNPSLPTLKDHLTVAEAAEFLGVSPWTLRNWDKTGKLKPMRHPVNGYRIYRQQDLEKILQSDKFHSKRKNTLTPTFDWSQIGENEHFVQFYETDSYLVESVADFLARGVMAGEGIIAVATRDHRIQIQDQLIERGLDIAAANESGQCIWLDAAETLAQFMVNGSLDRDRFRKVVGATVVQAAQGRHRVRAFGEMVALLWADGNRDAAYELERLWNELAKTLSFTLYCAYPLNGFGGETDGTPFAEVCSSHTRVIPAESYASLLENDDQLRAITALQQKAQALEAEVSRRKEAERELSDFLENALEGLHTSGPDGKIIWANKAELDLLGYQDDEYIGHHVSEFHADKKVIEDIFARLSAGEEIRDQEARLCCKDGSIKHVLINSNVLWQNGQFIHTRCFTRDITERKRAEQRLQTQNSVTRALAESNTLSEAASKVLQAVCEQLGWQVGDLWYVDQHNNVLCCADVYHLPTAHVPRFEATSHSRTFAPGVGLPGRVWTSGKAAWIPDVVRDSNFPRAPIAAAEGLHGALGLPIVLNGDVLGVMEFLSHEVRQPDEDLLQMMNAIGSQIGQFIERKRGEEFKTQLAEIVRSSNDAIISKSLNGFISSWNAGAERLFGYTAEEAIGQSISIIIPPDRADEEEEILNRIRCGERIDQYETIRRRKDGSLLDVSLTVSPVIEGQGKIVGASKIVRDVTERKVAEERFRLLAETVPSIVWIAAPDGTITYVNKRWLEYCGLTAEQNAQNRPELVLHPDDRQRCMEQWARSLRDGTEYEVEVRNRRFDGNYRWFVTRAVPLRGADKKIVSWFGVTTDIHDQKEMQEQLQDADRRKDEFLATLAHELRNPLAPIRNSLQILRMSNGSGPDTEQVNEIMERQVAHMVRLVDDLLELSRISRGIIELKMEQVDLATVISHAVETSRPIIEEASHHLEITLPTKPIFVEGDLVRLSQVFANLLNNAAKYTSKGGLITVAAKQTGREIVVTIRDTGIGIPREMLSRIFDMFTQIDNTLRGSQEGLGIGLNLVRTIVSLHGGSVEARSDGLGMGSEFEVRLPLAEKRELTKPTNSKKVSDFDPMSTRRILVVDDNRDAADSMAMLLKLTGAEVHLAYDGPSALEAIFACQPSVVFLDIGLPGISGHEVAKQVRADSRFRDVILIALTGWGQDNHRQDSQDAGFDYHLVKPVDHGAVQALLATLPEPNAN